MDGITDALMLARESLSDFVDGRQTKMMTRKQFSEELDTFLASLREVPAVSVGVVKKLEEFPNCADALAETVRMMIEEGAEGITAEGVPDLLFWTEAYGQPSKVTGAMLSC